MAPPARRLLPGLGGAAAAAAAAELGVFLHGSPPNYVANCPGGTFLARLPLEDTYAGTHAGQANDLLACEPSGARCSGGGPFLSVRDAATVPWVAAGGVYELGADPDNRTHQYYTKGDYTLLWEPGPRESHGLWWRLHGPAGPLYEKDSPDGAMGWRGTQAAGAWTVRAGAAPPPELRSERPAEQLTVVAAGEPAALGTYTREPGPHTRYRRGDYWIEWEPGPRVTTGLRWVIFRSSDPSGAVSQRRPYYYRLSDDGEYGYQGTWTVDQGVYQPPTVTLMQTVICARCPEGFHSAPQAQACARCPGGSYSLGAAAACTPCLAGTFANGEAATASRRKLDGCDARYASAGRGSCTLPAPGATRCEACPAGRYSDDGAGTCSDCPAGTAGLAAGSALGGCLPCGPGYWSAPAATVCTACLPGRAHNTSGSTTHLDCALCPPGRAAPAGAAACEECQAGRFAPRDGLSVCRACRAGSYSGFSGASRCTLCPDGAAGAGASAC